MLQVGCVCGEFSVRSVPSVKEAEMRLAPDRAPYWLVGGTAGTERAESWSAIAAGCDGRGDEVVMRGGAERAESDRWRVSGHSVLRRMRRRGGGAEGRGRAFCGLNECRIKNKDENGTVTLWGK